MKSKSFLFNSLNKYNFPKFIFNTNCLLESYLDKPENYWHGSSIRSAKKVKNISKKFAHIGLSDKQELTKFLLEQVNKNRTAFYKPFFVMGSGGSGSTWLGAMLGDLPGFQYAGEVYPPPLIANLYRILKNKHLSDFIWAIMLFHSFHKDSNLDKNFNCQFVNSARSIFRYNLFHKIWPNGRFVFIARDPRDQILSVTYRKNNYRNVVAPELTDHEYLVLNAKKYSSIYKQFKRVTSNSIYLVQYENLKHDTEFELNQINLHFQLGLKSNHIEKAVYLNDAQNMRAGKVEYRGNLDEGGRSKSWRELMTEEEKKIIRPYIQNILFELNYESDSHW
jgi:hypothetical protein